MARVCNYLYLYIKRKFFYPTGGSRAPKFNMIHQIIKAVKFGQFNKKKYYPPSSRPDLAACQQRKRGKIGLRLDLTATD